MMIKVFVFYRNCGIFEGVGNLGEGDLGAVLVLVNLEEHGTVTRQNFGG